jgi:hypothetical protein
MKDLHEEGRVSIFLFQDDDFPLVGRAGRRWVYDFIDELDRQKLLGEVIWKISCRVDEVEPTLLADMREAGLYLVYLGIESGTPGGLETLNKHVTVEDNLRAVAALKELDLMFGYGFMLFDPGSTFDSVRANIRFLREIIGDGSAAAVYCKMLPYAGTRIEKELAETGRLRGSIAQPDYGFLEPGLDAFYEKLDKTLAPWVQGADAVSHHLNLAWHEVAIIKRLFPEMTGVEAYEKGLRVRTKEGNERVFRAVEEAASAFENERFFPLSPEEVRTEARQFVEALLERRNAFVYRNQDRMLAVLAADAA